MQENYRLPEESMNKKAEPREILTYLKSIYENLMPFDRLLGVRIVALDFEDVRVRVDMKPEFVGNFVKNILHGGVISSVLDLTGGLVASVGVLERMQGETVGEILNRFARMGTIDLRVDYLRAGSGQYFLTKGSILRIGNKVAVVRTEFRNEKSILIAAGTGSYVVG
jgi:uncharacterized protein (TIGR00369 family)